MADEELFTTNEMARPASRLLVEKGRQHFDNGRYKEAEKHLERAANLAPTAEALVLWGQTLLKLRQFERAIIPLAAAATFDPDGPGITLLAETLMTLRRVEAAHTMAVRALGRNPKDRRAREVFVATRTD